jgi:SpoIID/LytB domain protein
VETAGDAVKLDDLPRLCESNQLRGYRGAIVVVDRGNDQGTVNRVRLDDYLRGVVPRESPASWGSAAGGSGLNALKAQAVAARSYALASRFSSYAQTCDSIRCQVYGGAFVQPFGGAIQPLEDARTDRAVLETTGEVRRNSSGAVARTEFSASTGGWSAGGEFPAVEDLGDATAANPHRSWSATFTLSEMASRLGTAPILDVQVAARNGLGSDGGRVLSVRVSTASGAVTFSGLEFRQRLGLKSDWFVVAGAPTPAASSYVTALYVDILQRQPDVASLAGWVDALAGGMQRADLARGFVYSTEHLNRRVDDVYLSALRRHAESSGLQGWVAALQRGTPWVSVVSSIYGSAESLASLGGGDVQSWVDATYQAILGRPAEPGAASWWAGFASERGRFFVARAIYTSAEARERRLDSYYRSYLQRPVDPAGLSGFGPMLVGNGDLDVPVGLVSSGEYWLRALDRFPP